MIKKDMKMDEAEEAALDAVEETVEELMDFESWHALREAAIPGHHRKEILKADFNARKVPAQATMAQFDAALRMYGVKLA